MFYFYHDTSGPVTLVLKRVSQIFILAMYLNLDRRLRRQKV